MTTLARAFLFASLAFGLAAPLDALDPARSVTQYNIRTWQHANGLPANAVHGVAQGVDGYLWLGTPRGLVRFDGIDFTLPARADPDRPRTLSVTSVARRSAGGVWLAAERAGIGYFDGADYVPMLREDWGGRFANARFVLESSDGSVLAGVSTTGGRWTSPTEAVRYANETDVLCIHEDVRGRIWLGTAGHGLLYWENGSLHAVDGEAGALWAGRVITAIAVDRSGLIWVGASNGLHVLDPDLKPRPPTGVTNQPRALLVDSHGVVWIGTLSEGLLRAQGDGFSSVRKVDGLASDRILSLAESDDGSLWVGTEDGLSQLADVKFPTVSQIDGLAAEGCLWVAADMREGLWAGTTNGLSHLRDGSIRSFGIDRRDGFQSRWIRRVFTASDGTLFLFGGTRILSRFRDTVVEHTWTFDDWPRALAEDGRGVIVAIGRRVFRIEGDDIAPYRLADGAELTPGWVNDLRLARDGSLWISTESGVFQVRDGVVKDCTAGAALDDANFLSLFEADDGTIWATRTTGLVRFKAERLATVDASQGLHHEFVHAVVADLDGNFWMDSAEGIFRVAQRDLDAVADGGAPRLHCDVFQGQHAFKTTDKSASDHSGCRTADGRIWFPSSKGVIMIDPRNVPLDARPPRTYINRILVNGVELDPHREPELKPGPGNLEFDYAALDYTAPERVRYRYRLEGYDPTWVEAGARRAAFFTNLPPGPYRFHVQAANADGVWNSDGATFALTLPHRLDQTLPFRVAIGLVALAVLGLAWRARERGRRHELEEIRAREELQRQLIESSPVALALLEDHRRVAYVNATFTRLFGFTVRDLPDMAAWWRLTILDIPARVAMDRAWTRRIESAARNQAPIEPLEAVVVCRDGTRRDVVLTTSEVGSRTLVVYSDLTDRKRAEEERRRLEELVRQGQKMEAIGQLSGGVAHDFNNLLTVILGNVALTETFERLPSDLSEPLHEIKDAARRAANLTRQLLAFSRKQPLRPAFLDLNTVVDEMAKMLRRIVGEHIAMDLRFASEPMHVRADAGMLEQVLLNLAVNARDAMPQGGRLTVTTEAIEIAADAVPAVVGARAGRFVRLSVTDTGTGIAPDVLPRIFEPFFTTKDVGKGTGLGLATVYGVVEQHGGWIAVRSTVGAGTTFEAHFPYQAPEHTPETAARASCPQTAGPRHVVLVVEDEDAVRALARRTLALAGCRVLEAANGPAALALWPRHRAEIDVLLTDIVMPGGMNGLELARRLLAEKPALRVIYTSGYSAELAGGQFAGREGIDFLAKPYDTDALRRIIDA